MQTKYLMNGKGEMLTKMSEFWFNATKHIIPNHMISTNSNEILVKSKEKPIKSMEGTGAFGPPWEGICCPGFLSRELERAGRAQSS